MQDPAVQNLLSVLQADQRSRYSGGIERFLKHLSTSAGRESWEEWRRSPVTQLIIDAVKSMSDVVPNQYSSDSHGIALSHGAVCGVNLAVRLMDDPTRVFPSIFDGEDALNSRQVAIQEPTAGYNDPPADDFEL